MKRGQAQIFRSIARRRHPRRLWGIPPAARKINTITSKSERLRADDCRDDLLFAFAVLIKHGRISVGERLCVLAADDQDID
jgi:hypothetical protein